ncbi:uncharacterized protein LOC126576673 [Anopheles aquasalis]|uniref:uncharacterized protein LOC126576673 n=1 Tax=Anopheles aquasalis TaxID=42839 RepID=UPI00215AE35F|nr:uncharacterized protein LOC126576673 [Anopheles aquasalis]
MKSSSSRLREAQSLECCWWATVLLSVANIVHLAPSTKVDDNLLYYESEQNDGGYRFEYRTKDGQFRTEVGVIDPKSGSLRISGSYEYSDDKGGTQSYSYKADENGYRLVPKEIQRTGVPIGKPVYVDPSALPFSPSYDRIGGYGGASSSGFRGSSEEYDGPQRKKGKHYHSLLGGNKRVKTSKQKASR